MAWSTTLTAAVYMTKTFRSGGGLTRVGAREILIGCCASSLVAEVLHGGSLAKLARWAKWIDTQLKTMIITPFFFVSRNEIGVPAKAASLAAHVLQLVLG